MGSPDPSAAGAGPRSEPAAARAARRVSTAWLQLRLAVRNRLSRAPVTGDADVVVSLTTYGPRLATAHYAVESVGRGVVRPRRIVLWVGRADAERLTPQLQRLRRRGLEVVATTDVGPHTKYHPYVMAHERHSLPLATADDDVLYPRGWLAGLLTAHAEQPGVVSCYRAWEMVLDGDRLAPYATWPPCRTTAPAHRHFLTGVGGVLYPPAVLDALRRAGTGFLTLTRANDDVWLNVVALRHGVPVRQVVARRTEFPVVLRSQRAGLYGQNVAAGRNDALLAAVYTDADLAALAGDARGTPG